MGTQLHKDFTCDQNLDGGRLERWFKEEDLALRSLEDEVSYKGSDRKEGDDRMSRVDVDSMSRLVETMIG